MKDCVDSFTALQQRVLYRENGGFPDSACILSRGLVQKAPVARQISVLWPGFTMDNLKFAVEPQWGESESTWYCGHYRPIVPAPDDKTMVIVVKLVE
jgi:hypothetical protein